jgi:hypothetical protein
VRKRQAEGTVSARRQGTISSVQDIVLGSLICHILRCRRSDRGSEPGPRSLFSTKYRRVCAGDMSKMCGTMMEGYTRYEEREREYSCILFPPAIDMNRFWSINGHEDSGRCGRIRIGPQKAMYGHSRDILREQLSLTRRLLQST